MLSKTCDAFKAAGAPEDEAREAAEEIAGFEDRLYNIESDVRLLKWIAGCNVALVHGNPRSVPTPGLLVTCCGRGAPRAAPAARGAPRDA